MSRWVQQFENHAFRTHLETLTTELSNTKVDDLSVITSVSELARLKKVVAYVDALLQDIDPELVPLATWDNFSQQAAACVSEVSTYNNNKNIGHIQNANSYADNLLTYVRPYMLATGQISKGLRNSVSAYRSAFEENSNAYKQHADATLEKIRVEKEDIERTRIDVNHIAEELSQARERLMGDGDLPKGELHELDEKITEFLDTHKKISQLKEEIFDDHGGKQSLLVAIRSAVNGSQADANKIKILSQQYASAINDLKSFHVKIFGVESDEGKRLGGLESELDSGLERLTAFEKQQEIRYSALNEQIESLLPGATSAGLASSSGKMKLSFDPPIKMANTIFYGAIAALLFLASFFAIDNISLTDGIELAKFSDWQGVVGGFALKAPFFAPLIWLAYYASARRSEFQRLQQEYAHKEVVANSYESYRKQIEALGDSGSGMLRQLLERAIHTISYNASETLDKKHGDRMPVHSAIEKLVDTADKLADKIPGVK